MNVQIKDMKMKVQEYVSVCTVLMYNRELSLHIKLVKAASIIIIKEPEKLLR